MQRQKKPCDPVERIDRALNSICLGDEVEIEISYQEPLQDTHTALQAYQAFSERLARA